jgi:hypothetical protein
LDYYQQMALNKFDVSNLSYEDFIEYFFTKPHGELWNLDPNGAEFILYKLTQPDVVVRYLTRFCVEFRSLADHTSLETLDEGITGMFGEAFFCLQSALWTNTVDLQERIQCIRSMYRVFADFVANCKVEVLVGCFFMWWDHICSSFWFVQTEEGKLEGKEYARLGEQERSLVDAMFETLVEVLGLNDARTQSCALHGLGHLHHPKVQAVVQEYIDTHIAELLPDGLAWLEKCRDGTVM